VRNHAAPVLAGTGRERAREGESQELQLDNSGNAFVVLYGNVSCASGSSLIEASLTSAPYTTYTTEFTVKSPETLQAG